MTKQVLKTIPLVLALLMFYQLSIAQSKSMIPPLAQATIEIVGTKITIKYDTQTIFAAEMNVDEKAIKHKVGVVCNGDKLDQYLLLTSSDWNCRIKLEAKVFASEEAFPCEVDRPNRGPLLVRHTSGLSHNLRNRAIYDRKRDWVLSVDVGSQCAIKPMEELERQRSFSMTVEGREIIIRFKPRYYQKHRGLEFFEPWTYNVWQHSVAGWISWFAFFDKVTEQDVIETADVFSGALGKFGYEYFQIDDGYQRGKGDPQLWLTPNQKFPNGLKYLAEYIKSKGLKPGLWTAATIDQQEYVNQHPLWFVKDADGNPARGNWIEYILDASNPEALKQVVDPLYRGLREQGWEYFKVDALRHLRYEGYNSYRDYFEKKKVALVPTYRKYMQSIRKQIGPDYFILGCWGIRPELIGLIDGCRIGDDGFAYAGLSQYNSFNNVIWRNDPDHIELNDDAYRSTMVTSLTGSLFMLTDKPAVYRTNIIEPAKRTVPVLFTLPGQIYDVDPSRSDLLSGVDVEVSGSGPRPFDAGYTPNCHLYQLELNRPFERWNILGRTGGEFNEIRFADLGLDPSKEYYVFEFWSKKLLGSFQASFPPGQIDAKFRSQAFCIRERKQYPQVLASSRHITCGGLEMTDVRWSGEDLAGKSMLVAGDPYVLYLSEPEGYVLQNFDSPQLKAERIERDGRMVKITLRSEKNIEMQWKATYTRSVKN
ncbi:MAG: glycoside hydrolase family 36 protein [bacterium]